MEKFKKEDIEKLLEHIRNTLYETVFWKNFPKKSVFF